ncbi:cellulose binding domain-containing protein [Streptomyces sp. NPDC088732]|uniref:cellulose binding domain-containing protein n=1 Tax=Streptomyces sp. NPDC088732 TaxID=3365879 RepID=UPI00381859FB
MGSARPSTGSGRPGRPARPARPADSGPRQPRRRAWGALKLLLLVVVVVAGGTAIYPAWRDAHQPPPELTVRYKAGTATATTARPWLEIVNTSDRRVRLGDVALRYYYTADGPSPYAFNCVQASMGCSDVVGRSVAADAPAAGADHYLEITFSKAAGTLAPGAKSGAIGLQLYRPGGGELDQRNDRSYSPAHDTFQASELVTGYLKGKRVWGDEPSGGAAAGPSRSATAPASAPAARPAPPSGIVFDDFHYSGPHDPALHAHGWLVRTSEGGPGIRNTWSADGVSFPADKDSLSGQVLQLRASTDGTRQGTTQAEVHTTGMKMVTGTFAARIHFTDRPTSGGNGDHINESFYMISPHHRARYSELDNEYQPNGGWGAPGPRLDTTTWRSAADGDRVTRATTAGLGGWHTMITTAANGVVTYSIDGKVLFRTSGAYYPTEAMSVNFNTWFVDLPFTGKRTWDMQVAWFYHKAGQAQSLSQVQKAVSGLAGSGTSWVNTLAAS